MIINEDFFDSQDIDVAPSDNFKKEDGALMSHTMILTTIRNNGLSVKKLEPESVINKIKNILKRCDLFTDYSFESVGFSETYKRENEEVYTFNDEIPQTDYLYKKYSAGKPLSRLVVTFTFNVMPDEDVSKTVFVKQFYLLCNKLEDAVVYHSDDSAKIRFTDNKSGNTTNDMFFNEKIEDDDARSVYEVLYGKQEDIAFGNTVSKLNFHNIYRTALHEFENDGYFVNMKKYLTLGEEAEIENESGSFRDVTVTHRTYNITYIHIHITNKEKIGVGSVYKMIQLLVLNQIPMQYMMRNYVVVVLHFSDEKLVGGLTRKTIDIPTDMRPDGIRKLRLSA